MNGKHLWVITWQRGWCCQFPVCVCLYSDYSPLWTTVNNDSPNGLIPGNTLSFRFCFVSMLTSTGHDLTVQNEDKPLAELLRRSATLQKTYFLPNRTLRSGPAMAVTNCSNTVTHRENRLCHNAPGPRSNPPYSVQRQRQWLVGR